MKHRHPHQPLAHNRTCQIEYCAECEVMHVAVGPVTLRLEPAAVHQVSRALLEALERVPTPSPTTTWGGTESRLPS
ncbi:MAG: hypothetical protein AB1Z98_06680 [Nannocystaceae bacterium]